MKHAVNIATERSTCSFQGPPDTRFEVSSHISCVPVGSLSPSIDIPFAQRRNRRNSSTAGLSLDNYYTICGSIPGRENRVLGREPTEAGMEEQTRLKSIDTGIENVSNASAAQSQVIYTFPLLFLMLP